MTDLSRRIVEHPWFGRAVLGVILAAAVVVGLETSPTLMDRFGGVIKAADWAILGLFIVEAVLKMVQHGRRWHRYFTDPWNVFDFSIIVVCLLPLGGHAAAVLRLARVLRALRLVSNLPRLQVLVGSLLKSMPSMVWVGLLLGLLFYIYAVLGVFLFRGNDPGHFGTLGDALLTLFRVVTLEDWTDVMYTQMYGSDVYPSGIGGEPTQPRAMPLIGVAYFVSFVLLGTMIILNLFIGVIINSMEEAQADAERRVREQHVAETGRPTVEDELAEVQHEVERLARRLGELRRQAGRE